MQFDKERAKRILELLPEAKKEFRERPPIFQHAFLKGMSRKLDELGELEFEKQGPGLLRGLIAQGERLGFF